MLLISCVPEILPVAMTLPVTLAPVVVAAILAVVSTVRVILPPLVRVMLEVPLLIRGMLALVVKIPRAAPMLPTLALPDAFNVPATLTPVAVTTTTLAVPIAEILTLPLAAGMFTFELPFACGPIKLPTVALPVDRIVPAILMPVAVITTTFAVPATSKLMFPPAAGMLTSEFPLARLPMKVFALITLAPEILPPDPDPVVILLAERFPVTFAVPSMFAPVPVTTRMLALPEALTVTLALLNVLTFAVPF